MSDLNPTFGELTEEVRKLNALLQDPQPGLFTWHEFLKEQSTRVKNLLFRLGY